LPCSSARDLLHGGPRPDRDRRPYGPVRRRHPLDVTLKYRGRHVGLNRPERRRQDDVSFNLLSGFVASPPLFRSRVRRGLCWRCRTTGARRWGLRGRSRPSMHRGLSVADNVRARARCRVAQHPRDAARGRLGAIGFVARRRPRAKVCTLGARERRPVQMARAVVASARGLLRLAAAGGPTRNSTSAGSQVDPRAHGRARESGRPRHEPRVGVLWRDSGARLSAS